MSPRHFLRDDDLSPAEQAQVLDRAAQLKAQPYSQRPLSGPQTAAVLFDKTSTRTRFSFATGIADLGGQPLIVNPGEAQLGAKESIADTAAVISRMVSLIVWRTYGQQGLEEMAAHSSVPVINALSDQFHPCQILADALTIREHLGGCQGRTFAYFGDIANNMAHSYLLGLATAGMHVRLCGPGDQAPDAQVLEAARTRARETGGSVTITDDAAAAAQGADVLCTDTWVSMGQEGTNEQACARFGAYQVTQDLMRRAAEGAIFMHCLPAYRGYEVAAEVIDGPSSVVFDQAENRLHAQKGLMSWLLEQAQEGQL